MSVFTRPKDLLRLEGAVTFAVATYLYGVVSADWVLFTLLLLVPDVSMLGYLRGGGVGAAVYNLFHTEVGPFVLGAAAVYLDKRLVLALALVWLAHIGLDRALGFGLKLATAFRDTHLGRIGRGDLGVRPDSWRERS